MRQYDAAAYSAALSTGLREQVRRSPGLALARDLLRREGFLEDTVHIVRLDLELLPNLFRSEALLVLAK